MKLRHHEVEGHLVFKAELSIATVKTMGNGEKGNSRQVACYLLVPVITGIALFLQFALQRHVDEIAFLIFYPAVFFSSWIGGLGPGLFSTVISSFLVYFYFLPPRGELGNPEFQYLLRLSIFSIMGILFSYLHSLLRKGHQRMMQSEREFRSFFELAGNGVEQVDPESMRFIRVNSRFCEMTGYSQEELLQLTFGDITHPDDREREIALYREMQSQARSVWEIEKRYVCKSGKTLWALVTGTMIRDEMGSLRYSIATIHDINDRKMAEDELKHQRNVLKIVTDNMNSALLMMDEKGHPTFLNPAGEKITGYKLEEMMDKPAHYSIHHKKPDGSFYPMEECPIDNGQADLTHLKDQEEIFVHKDGHLYPVMFSISPLERNGKPTGAVVEFRDITQEKEMRQKLEQLLVQSEFERRRFEIAMGQIPAAVIIAEAPKGKIVFSNNKIEEVWGHPVIPSESIEEYGQWQGVRPDGTPYNAQDWPLSRSITKGEVVVDEDCIVPQSNGTSKILRLSSSPVRDGSGKIIAGVVICQDITELVDAIRMRDEFLIIAAHELRTPITSLKLNQQMAQRRMLKESVPEWLVSALSKGIQQSDRLARLVEDLLDVSKIGSGRLKLDCEEVNFSELVESVVDNHREYLEKVGCSVSANIKPGIILSADRSRMEQTITNFLSNAAKYGEGKPIIVRLSPRDGFACLEIQDQGIGIPKGHQDRIFERFERAVSASSISGLGVGLYIAREIVAAHNGKILVESSPGSGSTFAIEIPIGKCS